MFPDATEMLHQAIEFFKRRSPAAFGGLFDEAKLPENSDGIVEGLAGEGVTSCRPRHREDVRQMGKVVGASLGFDTPR